MVQSDSFTDLMLRLREGDEAAATEVFGRFLRRLIVLASRQFDSWLRHRVDLEDVVQSAYKSFFAGQGQGRFELADWDSLWGLLAVITLRKCYRRRDYLRAERRDAAREVTPQSRYPSPGARNRAEAGTWWEAIDREPSPLEAAMLTETLEQLLGHLGRPEREIVELSLQGHTTSEIAARLGRSRRTVRRVRERVKDYLLRLQREDEDRDDADDGSAGAQTELPAGPNDPGQSREKSL
jgi:RNA polymerase sigma-70 factor (ECF subfamily)